MLELFWGRLGEKKSTRDSTIYLFNSFQFLGLKVTQKWKPLYYLYAVIILLSVILFTPFVFSISLVILFHQVATSQFLTSLQVAINISGCPCKIVAIIWNMKKLLEANDLMDPLDKRCTRKEEYEKIQNCIKFGNRVVVFFAFSYLLYSTLASVTSAILGKLPYMLYMQPLDWQNSKWEFYLQSWIEFILISYVCLYQTTVDSYAILYIYVLRTHMQILVERVSRLGEDEVKSKNTNYMELVECIKDHQNLLRLYNKISPVISVTIFVQFTITATLMGVTMINIFIFADAASQISCVVYLFAVLIQTSPCCYQATCLLDDSEQLPLAILQCKWWGEDKRFCKLLIFFMQCSQKPMTLDAMKLFPITLRTNLNIAKFSFSLYTLIKNMDFGRT